MVAQPGEAQVPRPVWATPGVADLGVGVELGAGACLYLRQEETVKQEETDNECPHHNPKRMLDNGN